MSFFEEQRVRALKRKKELAAERREATELFLKVTISFCTNKGETEGSFYTHDFPGTEADMWEAACDLGIPITYSKARKEWFWSFNGH